jgi:hypothetical protein
LGIGGKAIEVIEYPLEYSRPDKFTLHTLGDIHDGVIHCDIEALKKKIKKIKDNPYARWLGMGDYADLIVPSDFKRWEGKLLAPWVEADNIGPSQCDHISEILSPIWPQCIGLIEGNHDDGIRRYHHYNFMSELLKKAHKKNPNVKYAGVSCFVVLQFNRTNSTEKHTCIIHARHGEGCARTSGARSMAVLRLASSMLNAHITLMGHLHGQEAPDVPEGIIYKDGKIKDFQRVACMTGAWIRAYMQGVPPCYLERWGSPPSTLGSPEIIIEPDKDIITLEKVRHTREL